ncbi:MAG: ABC transporter ATP-binding protein [Paraglaciecola sp.]|nr:ABC transporter ATP-binding protein [Paraglaciecola sp.]
MLLINNISKRFSHDYAVQQLSLEVLPGEVFCLLGSNGAGKSTTLNLILGFLQADSGDIHIDQQKLDINDKHSISDIRQKIVYIPEQMNLYPQFSALENIEYLAQLSGISPTQSQCTAALTKTGLTKNMWDKPLKDYSKGMRQKVGIAFAIVREAKLLLLDEPTSGLDPSATAEFINIIQALAKQGAAVLMVTHDLECTTQLADKIAILKQGEIVSQFSHQDLAQESLSLRYHQAINPDLAGQQLLKRGA